MTRRLAGRTALITGAGRGLGRACATAFAAESADLVLIDVAADLPGVPYPMATQSQLDHTAQLARKYGAAVLPLTADVRDPEQIAQVMAKARERFGHVDVLVNNAGIVSPSGQAVGDVTDAEWAVMLDVNLTAPWRLIKAVCGDMTELRHGSIVNIASTAGLVGYRNFSAYAASKHGLVGLTKAAALDLAPYRVRVNAVCPGSIRDGGPNEGRMLAEISRCLGLDGEDQEAALVSQQPTNTLVEPGSVAAAVLWLASDESADTTGTVVAVDGGFSAR
jgi:NAD(P)-dependent dehydrogenase (short-subunit alcohol dehydrogenase family)